MNIINVSAFDVFKENLAKNGSTMYTADFISVLFDIDIDKLQQMFKNNEVIGIEHDNEVYYPTFQFTMNGVKSVIKEILPNLSNKLSSVRKCNFITEIKYTFDLVTYDVTVLELIQDYPIDVLYHNMENIKNYAKQFGTL